MPMPISEMRHVARQYDSGAWYGGRSPRSHAKFADELDALADQIHADNLQCKYVFGSFNPRRHEVSVSL